MFMHGDPPKLFELCVAPMRILALYWHHHLEMVVAARDWTMLFILWSRDALIDFCRHLVQIPLAVF